MIMYTRLQQIHNNSKDSHVSADGLRRSCFFAATADTDWPRGFEPSDLRRGDLIFADVTLPLSFLAAFVGCGDVIAASATPSLNASLS